MLLEHKYKYFVDGIFLLSEIERDYEPVVDLPFNIYRASKKVAAGYIRWSDDVQTKGHSFKIQEREVLYRAKLEGFQAVVLFVDQATSAFHKSAQKREKMKEMKNFVLSSSSVNAIIFYDESRVSRQIEDFALNIIGPIKFEKPGFKFYSTKTDGEWDENSPITQIKATIDHEESQKKSIRSYDYQKSHTYNSNFPDRPGSRTPFGYSKVFKDNKKDHSLKTNDDAIIVKLIFYLYSFGYSDKKIATLLNSTNVNPPSLNSNWSDSSVRYILNNLWYTGNLVWFTRTSYENSKPKPLVNRFFLQDHHKPLIGPHLWATTQFIRNHKQNKDRMDSPFVLRDLVYCDRCQDKLSVKNMSPANSKKKYLYYHCKYCKKKLNLFELHTKIFEEFTQRWGREIERQQDRIKGIYIKWKKTLETKISEQKEQLYQLRYKFSFVKKENEFFQEISESFKLQINFLEQEQVHLKETLEKLEHLYKDSKPEELFNRFKEDIYKYSNEEKRAIFLLSIKKISINFERENFSSIDYRLTPYVEIEKVIDDINEGDSRIVGSNPL
jgi:site-specific DNA recombinase